MKLYVLAGLAALALSLSACKDYPLGTVEGRSFLDTFEGPKVDTVGDTLLKTAKQAEAEGNTRKAAQYYQQLSDANPTNMDYKTLFADSLRKLGDVDRANTLYNAVLESEPEHIGAKEGRGLALLQRGELALAESQLTALRATGKASWRTSNALGIIATTRQNFDQARIYFTEALRMSPDNPAVLNNIGLSQALVKDFPGAMASMQQASLIAQSKPAIRQQIDLNTALVYAASGKLEDAESVARKYFDGPTLNNNLGFYAHVAKDDQLAKTYLNMALTQSKTFYQRAWQNLEALNIARSAPASATAPAGKTVTIAEPEHTLKLPETAAPTPAQPVAFAAPEPAPIAPAAPVATLTAPAPVAAVVPAVAPAPQAPAQAAQTGTLVPLLPASTQNTPETATQAAPAPAPAPVQQATPYEYPALAPAAGSASVTRQEIRKEEKNTVESGFEAVGNWVGGLLD